MNTILLLVALRCWDAPTSLAQLTRIFAAISIFSVEMQIATWSRFGSIRMLALVNLVAAVVMPWVWRPPKAQGEPSPVPFYQAVSPAAAVILAALVLTLNVWNPLEAADPYHLDRVERIGRVGTLAYDLSGDVKTNILSPIYEAVLADLRQTPVVGAMLLRIHGVLNVLLYLVAIGAVRELLRAGPGWQWTVMLVVPVVFHQFVLVKNDLFVGVLGVVALAWLVARSEPAPWSEIVWASWLTGFAVAVKLTSLPLAVILAGAILIRDRGKWQPASGLVLGGALGALTGGLIFTLIENIRVYGTVMPSAGISSRYESLTAALEGLARFAVSLIDLGLLTRYWEPGRGGWGGTFGLPLIWALAVLASLYRQTPHVRRALLFAAVHFVSFALVFPDADLSQRLALAPGLLLIGLAVDAHVRSLTLPPALRMGLLPVIALSGAQVARSAVLYLMTP